MRMSVLDWTVLQESLPNDDRDLWNLIEHRTFGKPYSADVSIAIPKRREPDLLRIMHDNGLKLVTTGTEPCDHFDGEQHIERWLCWMCDGKDKRKITTRAVPDAPSDSKETP